VAKVPGQPIEHELQKTHQASLGSTKHNNQPRSTSRVGSEINGVNRKLAFNVAFWNNAGHGTPSTFCAWQFTSEHLVLKHVKTFQTKGRNGEVIFGRSTASLGRVISGSASVDEAAINPFVQIGILTDRRIRRFLGK
jgi:hypothetical protein